MTKTETLTAEELVGIRDYAYGLVKDGAPNDRIPLAAWKVCALLAAAETADDLHDEMKKIALATGRSKTDGEEDCDWAFLGEEVAEMAERLSRTETLLRHAVEARERAEETWRCFSCGFSTADRKEAAAHFGDGDGHPAICVWWADLSDDDRLKANQQMAIELDGTRNELYAAEGHLRAIHEDFHLMGGAKNSVEAYQKYDDLEGRLIAEQEHREAAEAHVVELEAAIKQALDGRMSTYRARNGRQMGIEADDGEKCWIIHSEDIFALEAALSLHPSQPQAAAPGKTEEATHG